MSRMAFSLAVLICCAAAGARAEDTPPRPPTTPSLPHAAAKAAKARPKARAAQAGRAAVEPIVGSGTATRAGSDPIGPARGAAGEDAWSLSPKWNASNGGTSAAYGTRALVNELHSNPAETTGYGAGAQVDFHF